MLRSLHLTVSLLLICLLRFSELSAQTNAIVTENAKTGNPASEWDIDGAGDRSIQGFATDISYNKGETAIFKIKTNASSYLIKIYRLGYYQGNGARLITTLNVTGVTAQPACETDGTGLVDCGNWAVSAQWAIPATAVSGIYLAKLIRNDNLGASHIAFVVRDDASTSDLFFQTSDATWQAYNVFGDISTNGKSLYTGVSGVKSPKVSYNRPFLTREGGGGGGAEEDWLFNSEYPMIRFLERNGYDMSYTTDVDTERRGNLILNHDVFMSVGHDEYWSKGMRDNVAAARNAGKHLAFFGGNEVYWKTRWERSITDTSNDLTNNYRTLVCYKEGNSGENTCGTKCDPTSEWTGLWRSGCEYGGANGCKPENELSGQASWNGVSGTIQVPSEYKNLRFWRNTSVASLDDGETASLTPNTLGYEWDPEQESYRSSYPAGRIILSSTILDGQTHHLTLYKHNSGALVFAAGTVQWTWGLDINHDRYNNEPVSPAIQQATINLFADMHVQPGTLQAGLVAATASNDTQAPTHTITSPSASGNIPSGSTFTIKGTAADAGTIAGIEVSTDGGTTWRLAKGTNTWTFAWTPTTQGNTVIRSRAFDDSGNISAVATVNVTVTPPVAQSCPCTVFNEATDAPAGSLYNDNGNGIQLGMKFHSNTDGSVTGVRFYKQAGNSGTHTGQLYNSAGVKLAEATFVNETASGWQQVSFASPVAITANTTYIISYHSSAGYYSATNMYFAEAKINGVLRGLANGEDGNNGVYSYTSVPAFPTDSYGSSNYYVDVVFSSGNTADTTPPAVASTSPAANASAVNVSANITVVFNEAISENTVSASTIRLLDAGSPVPAAVTYDANTLTATLNPASNLDYSTNYTISVTGGNSGVTDLAGNELAANYNVTFTTQGKPGPSPNDGPGGPILVISDEANPFSRYPVEILRAEGLNEFAAKDISDITATPSLLNDYDVIILGEISLSAANVNSLTTWVNAGGTLIAFKPNEQLASLFGITAISGSLTDKYLKINASGPGVGIVNETIQFHGQADLYTLSGAASLANLYSSATVATSNPAVTTRDVGSGKAIAFTYDLAKSVVYTRQGNPAWAGQKRDGQINPIRSDDMFFPDWVDFNKIEIPQADEQQRFLANIILQSNLEKKPLPRFWYLPRGLKAAVIMTGDDHGNGGTIGRFNDYISKSPSNDQQAVNNWTAVRGTSYIYSNTPITNAQAAAFQTQGFEIALHLNTNCGDYTVNGLRRFFDDQLPDLAQKFPGLSPPTTNRTHCIAWSDWATKPKVELEKGIRLDADYYYWPEAWVNDRPGMFTGSGMPMRFADLDGSLIDVYQAVTQLTDESGITYAAHINKLLDNAIDKGYYGVFTANMHTDQNGGNSSDGSDAIVASALQRQIPVVSAKQMLTWLDGRNNSSFKDMTWSNNALNFTITTADGSTNLRAMLPVNGNNSQLTGLTMNNNAVTYTTENIKGILYAFFPAINGIYKATYGTSCPTLVFNPVTGNALPNATEGVAYNQTISVNATGYTFTATGLPSGLSLSSSGLLNGTPANAGSEFNITVTATKGTCSANASYSLNVSDPPNQAPVLTPVGSKTATVGQALGFTATATDPDAGQTKTFSLTGNVPGGATINASTGVFSWTPTTAGPFTVTVKVTDNGSPALSDEEEVKITVSDPPNQPPVLTPIGSKTATVGQALGFTATATDPDAGQSKTFSLTGNVPDGATINASTGVFSWTPTTAGPFTVTVKVTDNGSPALSDEEEVKITVSDPPNQPPVLTPIGSKTATVGQALGFTATATDPDAGQSKTFSLTGNVPDGATINASTGVFSWTPTTAGPFTVTVKVTDNGSPALSDEEEVKITVSDPPNQPPVLTPIGQKTATVGQALGFTATATDPDAGQSKTFSLTGNVPGGATINASTGVFSWTPTTAGPFTITVKVTDNGSPALSDEEDVKITVSDPPNQPPVLTPVGSKTATVGQALGFTATATDPDAGQSKTFSLTGNVPGGATINPSTGVFSWTPTTAGPFTVTVKVTDNGSPALSDEEEVKITVSDPPNQPPVLTPIGQKTATVGQALGFTATATDPDAGQSKTFSLTGNVPGGATINPSTGVFSWTPTTAGPFTVTVKVTDNGSPALSDEEVVNVVVSSPAATTIRINSAGSEYTATENRQFMADVYFSGTAGTSSALPGTVNILNTTDDVLYRTARSSTDFVYNIPVQNGSYKVVLHFAETYFGAPEKASGGVNKRKFNVDIEGSRKLTDYDIYAKAGGAIRPVLETFTVAVNDNYLNINFTKGTVNQPILCAIEVTPQAPVVNRPPVLTSIGDKTATVGQVLTFTATATDPDAGQTKTFSLTGTVPGGATINSSTGVFSWTPSTAGLFTFKVKVTDNGSPALSDEKSIQVTVNNPPNQAPVLSAIGNKSVTVGKVLSFTATATDPNAGQTKTFSLTGTVPAGATINASTGVFSWTPTATGTFPFTVKVTDNGSPTLSDEEAITVTVSNIPATAIRINSAGSAYTATGNRPFIADAYYGGTASTASPLPGTVDILNTTDDVLYRSERSSEAFNYDIPVQNGSYNVILHFAETYFGAPGKPAGGVGKRKFNVAIENVTKLTNYDVYAKAGGSLRPVLETFPVTVTDGRLNINFTKGTANIPKLSAIEVIPVSATAVRIAQEDISTAKKEEFSKSETYPNPTHNKFTIKLSGRHKGKVSMKLIGTSGKVFPIINPVNIKPELKTEVDVSVLSLPEGIYLLKIQSASATETLKVLILD
ncbi:N,N-dimethylformamidase beta subunit family domain-containing protein [Dyadobacter sp. NIV53]|uniref:N,N-dimethylformamidase beta subunit family domain-containing protein n=1 Tax=Dyadobacter sp. NIV53 TaxID=2861765 RepID=UPI001C87A412|nr:N,N-dimethylformamidase beta subunit family domain-containing protein [Dyadobacter sp. NIV53]